MIDYIFKLCKNICEIITSLFAPTSIKTTRMGAHATCATMAVQASETRKPNTANATATQTTADIFTVLRD